MSDIHTAFDIYRLVEKEKDEDNQLDPSTSTGTWKHYFKQKAHVFKQFAEGMRKVSKETEKVCNNFNRESVVNFSHAKIERMFDTLREWDRKLYEDAFFDANLFMEIKNAISMYRDGEKDKAILRNYEQRLKSATQVLAEQMERVDAKKEKYFKKAFEMEKAEIKLQFAEKEEEIRKFTEKFEALKAKVTDCVEKYREEFENLLQSGNNLKDESYKYTEARSRVDCKRADFILHNLESGSNEAKMKNGIDDIDLERIRVTELIKSRRPLQKIVIKKMQEYKSTENKEELIKQLKMEVAEERAREQQKVDGAHRRGDHFEESSNDTAERTLVVPFTVDNIDVITPDSQFRSSGAGVNAADDEPPGLSHARGVGSKLLVIRNFKKQEANQISLTQGKYIKLIMPANDRGFAFGEKKGRFGKKKKGYFPISHVASVD